ncbi:DUF4184 family protein [Paenibacillus sp. NEAU-GSW1]|uniref:DUF4184 family protein n=1 Tax=Paenibacillus sp. NEAU-GSW1 TaxID=2682486 RepID=UPI0012E2867D|nr:DUF4184 family protein [Paenibacillus sp. NEAU-GSW1]MUT66441.1 DUF4184 family protein [Paenibacillus sp. NEAU-GSW1]
MPFTLSHPILAAPLKKAFPSLSLSGLILGSMAPDLEYFVAMQSYRSIGHSVPGFVFLGLPLCIALAVAFHRVIKPALPALLPSTGGINRFVLRLIEKSGSTGSAPSSGWALFVLSAFIGFFTHIFFDGWTHRYGWFALRIPFLIERVGHFGVYYILQIGLTLLGVGLPALWLLYKYVQWRTGQNKARLTNASIERDKLSFAFVVVGIALAALLLGFKIALAPDPLFLNIWVVAPFTAAGFGLFCAAQLHIAKVYGRLKLATGSLALLLTVIGGGVLLRHQYGNDIGSWVQYHWLLVSALIIASVVVKGNKRPERM